MFYSFDGIQNFRDLGGAETTDGRRVRGGYLFRCGELARASDSDMERLSGALGVRTVVDFRDAEEEIERPDRPVAGAARVVLKALPSMEKPRERVSGDGPPPDAESIFPGIYRMLAETPEAHGAYRAFFRLLLDGGGAPLLFHCRQGKDRTGVAAILLLTALGVPRERCVEEYLQTNEFMQGEFDRFCAGCDVAWKRDMMRILFFVRTDWLAEFFNAAERLYGGVDGYLRDAVGLTDADRERLRALYLA